MTLDDAIEQLEKELPGFHWNLSWDGKLARCVLTSPDFKSHIWEAGGKTTEEIESGVRVVWCSPSKVQAVLGAIKVAKDQMND